MHNEVESRIILAAGIFGAFYAWQIVKAAAVAIACPGVFVPLAAVVGVRAGYLACRREEELLPPYPDRPVKHLGRKLNYN